LSIPFYAASTGDLVDVDKAISNHERALSLTPDNDADISVFLNNIGIALLCRFDVVDCGRAVSVLERAENHIPDGILTKWSV